MATRSDIVRRAWVKRKANGWTPPLKGIRHSAEAKTRMRAAALARPSNRLGQPHTAESRELISTRTRERALRGSAAPGYRDGRSAERRDERRTIEYKRWRADVYRRDGYACRRCGDARGGNLVAHHVLPFATHPELRCAVGNGVTLCVDCHKEEHRNG